MRKLPGRFDASDAGRFYAPTNYGAPTGSAAGHRDAAAEFSDMLKLPRLANIFRVASDVVGFIVMPSKKIMTIFKRALNLAQHISAVAQTKKLSAIIGLIKLGVSAFETAKEIYAAVKTKMVYDYYDAGNGPIHNYPDKDHPGETIGAFRPVWRLQLNAPFAGGFSDLLFRALPVGFLTGHAELGFALFRGITLVRLGKKAIETGIQIKTQVKTISTRIKPSGQLAMSLPS